jgi:hypothetical protein
MNRREMILRTGAVAPGLNLPSDLTKFKAEKEIEIVEVDFHSHSGYI